MPINPFSGLFQRAFRFTDAFAQGDGITREDLDEALDDFVPAINQGLEQKAAAEAAALDAQGHAEAAATAGATAGAAAGAEAAVIAAAEQVALAAAYAQLVLTAANDGTRSSGTYTPSPVGGFFRRIINGGAFTLAAPTFAGDYQLTIQITNNATAGAITLTGFSRATGDSLTTTDGHDFLLVITKINGFTLCERKALQ